MFPIPTDAKGLIFDCDGTLADTMPLHLRSWERAMGEMGGRITPAEFWSFAGTPTMTIIEILNARHGFTIDPVEGCDLKERYYIEAIHTVEPIAEVVAVVEAYRGKLPMAVATGGQAVVVGQTLKQIGLLDMFEHIVSADDVKHGKPAPDIFLEAARRLKVAAKDCVVFEDADNGVLAAEAAGMVCIDVRKFDVAAHRRA